MSAATSTKGTFLFYLRLRPPIKLRPSSLPRRFPNGTYPRIFSRRAGRSEKKKKEKQLDLLLYTAIPSPSFHLPVQSVRYTYVASVIAQWIPKLDRCSLLESNNSVVRKKVLTARVTGGRETAEMPFLFFNSMKIPKLTVFDGTLSYFTALLPRIQGNFQSLRVYRFDGIRRYFHNINY